VLKKVKKKETNLAIKRTERKKTYNRKSKGKKRLSNSNVSDFLSKQKWTAMTIGSKTTRTNKQHKFYLKSPTF
jgi:hypothetical protein